MLLRKSLTCALVIAAVSIIMVAAQTAQPKRQPDVPYVPTTEEAVKAMLKLADVKKTDIVYDLGCGMAELSLPPPRTLGLMASESILTPCASARRKKMLRRPAWKAWSDSKRTTCS